MTGFKKVKAVIDGKLEENVTIAFDNKKILYVGRDENAVTEEIPVGKNSVVLPGFIDEHVHGAVGYDFTDGTEAAVKGVSSALLKEGTTTCLATLSAMPEDGTLAALRAIKRVKEKNDECAATDSARIAGVNLEGPFLSEKFKGGHSEKNLRLPDYALFERYCEACGNIVRAVTVAPELEGAEEFVKKAAARGSVCFAGHTDATYGEIERSAGYGVRAVTHVYNAQRGFAGREPGTVGAALYIDDLFCELICDCFHVSAPAVKLLFKNKPKNKIILITDAVRVKGANLAEAESAGLKIYMTDGHPRLADGTIAGSVLKMNEAIKNAVERCGADFADAVRFATANPADNIGLADRGRIKEGLIPDFCILGEGYEVEKTLLGGRVVYEG